jgi:hypothetical protein
MEEHLVTHLYCVYTNSRQVALLGFCNIVVGTYVCVEVAMRYWTRNVLKILNLTSPYDSGYNETFTRMLLCWHSQDLVYYSQPFLWLCSVVRQSIYHYEHDCKQIERDAWLSRAPYVQVEDVVNGRHS